MAERNFAHQPSDQQCGLEATGRSYDPPLLPYEIALIEALGCTEDEYRRFVRHAQLQARVRPAEYAHIPDISNDVVSIAISLVIGLALTAVSTLLAPKAPALETPAKIRGKKLADQIGPTRFNQTTSFDNVSSLAEYGQPIPIPFGKRGTGADGALTGGLVLAPALVWSRLYSYGSYQAFEGIYVAGECEVSTPELGGIRVGTTALSSLSKRDFAVYWSSKLTGNRPDSAPRIAGTDGPGATGTMGRRLFTAPITGEQYSQSFCMAYNPQADVLFGTAEPIHNGTSYRFNWEIISAPYSSLEGDDNEEASRETRARRRKIAGSEADRLRLGDKPTAEERSQVGQPGEGRSYSRRMGFIQHNTTIYDNKTTVSVNVDDTLVFEINGTNWLDFQRSNFEGTEVNLKDLKSSAEAWRERASDLLVIGSTWIIGSSVWVVESRYPETWTKGITQNITLRCVEITGVSTVGIAGTRTIRDPLAGYDGGQYDLTKHCGITFYPLCRLHTASIRPVRRDVEVIEIGIRSQVWNKANGLCNFNAVPSARKLHNLDKKDITLNTPRLDKYFNRTSCFSLWVRPVQIYGQPEKPWRRIPEIFCVTGNSPTDQFNYLNIRPHIKGYYEYRLVPRTGADIAINSTNTELIFRLDASSNTTTGLDYATDYGTFRITSNGSLVAVGEIKFSEEMTSTPNEVATALTQTQTVPVAIEQYAMGSDNGSIQQLNNAWLTSVLGYARDFPGKTNRSTITFDKPGVGQIVFAVSATSISGTLSVDYGPVYLEANRQSSYIWKDVSYSIISATGQWTTAHAFTVTRDVNNDFSAVGGYTKVGYSFKVTAVQTVAILDEVSAIDRAFEENTQVADCSYYSEISKSNENGPEHEVVYVNETVANETLAEYYNMSTLGFTVKSSGQLGGVGQLRLWVPAGIKVTRLIENDNTPSNLFADLMYYLLTSKRQGVGNIVPAELIDIDSLRATAKFQRANQIFFDGVIEDSDSFRSFLYDNAALQLCSFTIKNGRFGMMPALPYDSDYKISTNPIAVEQIFTSGNIIADSLQVQYIDAAQRSNFRALVSWRVTIENDLPLQTSALVDWADIPEGSRATTQQAFDLTDFCTNRAQALKTARFLLSIRRRVTHTVSFKTVPDALGIQPGSYIRVITSSTTYSASNNGAITDAGTLVSITSIANGTYDAMIYNPADRSVVERQITINNNTVSDGSLYGTLFTLISETVSKGVYQVEQLTLDEDGLVNVSAVEVPVDSNGASIVAKDVLTESNFRVLE
jgi:hypothetical protein